MKTFIARVRRSTAAMYARVWLVLVACVLLVAALFGWTPAVGVAALTVVAAFCGWQVYHYDSPVKGRIARPVAAKLFLAGMPVWAVHGSIAFTGAVADSLFGPTTRGNLYRAVTSELLFAEEELAEPTLAHV